MIMQVQKFPNGGFVCHKMQLSGMTSRYSAWFDKDRNIEDAEKFDSLNHRRDVRRDSLEWKALQQLGKSVPLE
jgi:hypothetical protein